MHKHGDQAIGLPQAVSIPRVVVCYFENIFFSIFPLSLFKLIRRGENYSDNISVLVKSRFSYNTYKFTILHVLIKTQDMNTKTKPPLHIHLYKSKKHERSNLNKCLHIFLPLSSHMCINFHYYSTHSHIIFTWNSFITAIHIVIGKNCFDNYIFFKKKRSFVFSCTVSIYYELRLTIAWHITFFCVLHNFTFNNRNSLFVANYVTEIRFLLFYLKGPKGSSPEQHAGFYWP